MATLFVDKIDPQSGTSLEIGSSGDTISKGTGVVSRLGVFESQLLHVRDEKDANTNGGTSSVGVNTRTLNTVKTNEITGASLSSNQITLPAGTYYIEASAPLYRVYRCHAYLYNVTDSSNTIVGQARFVTNNSTNSDDLVNVNGRFTISAQKVFELRQYTSQSGGSTSGLGITNSQTTSVYADVKIWRTA